MLKMQLASIPHEEPGTPGAFPDWPVTHCDGFLLDPDGKLIEPPALIQLVSNGRIKSPLPQWSAGDIATLTPLLGGACNDIEDTGRCYLDLYIRVACEGKPGWLEGMIPRNPDLHDFTKNEH